MTFAAIRASSRLLPVAWLTALLIGVSGLLASCGGGGVIPSPGVQVRPLDPSFATRKAVAYSPFRTNNRNTETITAPMVLQDLQLLVAAKIGLIRLYDSSDAVSKLTLQVIQQNALDIKVQLGAYVSPNNDAGNQAELQRCITLANTYRDIVLAVSVGNETLYDYAIVPLAPKTLAGYIATVRAAVTQPVTTDDQWPVYAGTSAKDATLVLNQIDFAAIHTYSLIDSVFNLWNWQQTSVPANQRAAAMMQAAVAEDQSHFDLVRKHLDALGLNSMPIVIGEIGWKAVPTGNEIYRASPINQKMYYDALTAWQGGTGAKPLAIFYFEAFDEPWKGSDDGWGLFDVNRKARCAIQPLLPTSQWVAGQDCNLADALYDIPVTGNPAITASRYTVYADVAVGGEAKPSETVSWVGFNSPATAFAGNDTTTFAPGDGPNSLQVTPAPQNATPAFGWGLIALLPTTSDDLSNFVATGTLNFSIKSTYPGKIQVGFLTGSTTANTAVQAYLVIDPSTAQYGYVNDGNWHQVSIPISAIVANATPAYGQPSTATLDMTQVTQPFTIADLYASTGKTAGFSGSTTTFNIDDIYWSK